MFFPWYSFALLGFEANSVIALRVSQIGQGGAQSLEEIQLMFQEKADALVEAATNLMTGGTVAGLVDRYRVHVAANQTRLSTLAGQRSGQLPTS